MADIIKCWMIFHGELDVGLRGIFSMAVDRRTRGHSLKLVLPRCNLEMQKRFFHVRAVQRWNSLSEHTVMHTALPSFKRVETGVWECVVFSIAILSFLSNLNFSV